MEILSFDLTDLSSFTRDMALETPSFFAGDGLELFERYSIDPDDDFPALSDLHVVCRAAENGFC